MDPIFRNYYVILNHITKKEDYHFNIKKSEIKNWRSEEKNSVNWKQKQGIYLSITMSFMIFTTVTKV